MPRSLGEQPLKPFTGLLAGQYLYRSNPEDPGQLVEVTYVEGQGQATVLDGEDAGLVLSPKDMGGTFDPVARALP